MSTWTRKSALAKVTGGASASSVPWASAVRVIVPDFRQQRDRALSRPGRRYRQRTRKLTPLQESAIRALAASKSLRSLAADFDVSHETVRTVVRTSPAERPEA